jgi:ribose/xylose/arabinose/galactoside ABC-type transport system permease subunit
MGLVAVLISDLMQGRSTMAVPALVLALGIGTGVGLLNGVLINRLRIHPLILTLGMLSVLQGTIFLYTDRSVGRVSPEVLWLASGSLAGIPVSLLLVAVLATGGHAVLQSTRFGWHLQAVGASEENARRAGINTWSIKLAAYGISGFGAGIAGVLLAGRLGTGYPNAGAGFELDAIVAVVLGGTSLAGGRATIPGTIAAVVILAIASNMLNLLAVPAFGQMVAKGLIVITAILLTQRRMAPA